MISTENNIPEGWREVKLGDVINLIGGGTPKTSIAEYWNGNIPWLSVVDFNNGNKRVYKTQKHITAEGLKNSPTKLLRAGQLIISARGTVGALAQIGSEMAFNQSCYGIDAKKEFCINDFLYYLIKREVIKLKSMTHGAVFDTITKETFNHIITTLPPIEEQERIAGVLGSFDDKIELLREQNKTLEDMAKAIFKSWFVDFDIVKAKEQNMPMEAIISKYKISEEIYHLFPRSFEDSPLGKIPLGWEVKKIENVCTITSSKRIFMSDYVNKGIPFYRSKEIIELHNGTNVSTELYIKEELYENIKNKFSVPKEGDILMTSVGTLAIPYMLSKYDKFYFKDGNLTWFKDFIDISNIYILLFIKYNKKALCELAIGSTQKALTINTLKSINFVYTSSNLYVKFDSIVKNLHCKINENSKQIQTLTQTRDALLPKLISGQIKV